MERRIDRSSFPDKDSAKLVGLGIESTFSSPQHESRLLKQPEPPISPSSKALKDALNNASREVEHLKQQVELSRTKRRSSHSLTPSPLLQSILQYRKSKGSPQVEHTHPRISVQHHFGNNGLPVVHPSRHNLPQVLDCNKSLTSNTVSSAMRTVRQQVLATVSPLIPASTRSTPQLSATPTVSSSPWMTTASPSIVSPSSFPTPATSANAQTHQSQKTSNTNDQFESEWNMHRNHAVAGGIAGGVTGSILLILLLIWAAFFRKRKQKKRQELDAVLEKVAPPNLPPKKSSSFSAGEKESFSEGEKNDKHHKSASLAKAKRISSVSIAANAIKVRLMPTFGTGALTHGDLETTDRHSYELRQSGLVGHTVSRDMSFSWQFPKLSVPPAAARALRTSHYVKKRCTLPCEGTVSSLSSIGAHNSDPSASVSRQLSALLFEAGSGRSESAHLTSAANQSTPSAVPSSDFIDPHMVHSHHQSMPQKRTRWWNSSLRGFSQSSPVQSNEIQIFTTTTATPAHLGYAIPTVIQDENGFFHSPEMAVSSTQQSHDSLVLLSQDPVMQSVLSQIMSMSRSMTSDLSTCQPPLGTLQDGTRLDAAHLELTLDSGIPENKADGAPYELALHRSSSAFRLHNVASYAPPRRVSWAGSTLEPCKENSRESVQLSSDLRRTPSIRRSRLSNAAVEADEDLAETFDDDNERRRKAVSAAYSAHSISIHPKDYVCSYEGDYQDMSSNYSNEDMASTVHSLPHSSSPLKLDVKAEDENFHTAAPKIWLTSTEEDGRHERQISMTSASTFSGSGDQCTIDDSLSNSSGSDSLEQFGVPTTPTTASTHDFIEKSAKRPEDSIDSFIIGNDEEEEEEEGEEDRKARGRYERDSDSTLDSLVGYAAGRQESHHRFIGHQSVTASENGSLCLIDEDFPTIPSWKSMTQTSHSPQYARGRCIPTWI